MTDQRYKDLMWEPFGREQKPMPKLAPEEIALGWHYCFEFDGLLIGPGWSELDCCHCLDANHPVYKTAPAPETIEIDEKDIL